MFISMESAFYINIITSTISLGFILMYAYKHKYKELCAPCFIIYFITAILTSLMIALRPVLGVFLSVIFSNGLSVIGLFILYKGIARTIKMKSKNILIVVTTCIFFGLYTFFTYAYDSIFIRIILINLTHMFISILIFYTLQKSKKKFSLIDEFMSLMIFFYFLILFVRLLFNIIYVESESNFLSFTMDPIFILLLGLSKLMFLSGILSLYNNDFLEKFVESERKQMSLIGNLPGFAYRCLNDKSWTMEYVSPQFKRITGYSSDDVIQNTKISYDSIIDPVYRNEVNTDWQRAIQEKKPYIGEYKIIKKNGESAWVWEQGILAGEVHGKQILEGFIMDITKRKEMETHLEILSYYDALTNLHNRRYKEQKLHDMETVKNYPISIIMGDINGLKFVNDTFGHDTGDEILKYVASCIVNVIKNKDIISRISGDEFVILLENTSGEQAESIVNLIQQEVKDNNPFQYEVSISLGAATTYDDSISLSSVEKIAEDNMYKEKIYAKPSIQRKTIDAVLRTLHEKDALSEEHSQNVSMYAKRLAKKLGFKGHEIQLVETAALLHDVGKIIIPKEILTSPNKLTKAEYEEIKKHPEIGYRILNSVPELGDVAKIILYHHEHIDGSGYPKGLKGEDIPLISRLISVCDAFDAMVNKRLYRKAISVKKAVKELMDHKDTQFDKQIVNVFVENIHEIIKQP